MSAEPLIYIGVGLVLMFVSYAQIIRYRVQLAQAGHTGQASLVKKRLLTPNEREFYGRLQAATKGLSVNWQYQVSMGALMDLKGVIESQDPGSYWMLRNQFANKIVDFVMVDKRTNEVLALIELDDMMHDAQKDAQRDALTASAGYKTIRWHSRNKPSVEEIRKQLEVFVKP